MKKVLMSSIVMFAMAAPAFAQSAPARVAVFNVQKVVAESNSGKAAYERLKKLQDERAARAQKMEEEIRAIETEVTTKRMSLSEERVAEMRKQFDDKRLQLQRFAQDADRELTEARDKSLADLERQLVPVISEIGKEMGFALIFNRMDSGIVFASDAVDITDVIIKKFNERTNR
jgi:outer membrane protein